MSRDFITTASTTTDGEVQTIAIKILSIVHMDAAGWPLCNPTMGRTFTSTHNSLSKELDEVNCKMCRRAVVRAVKGALPPVLRCRYRDCFAQHPIANRHEKVTCARCLADMGFEP